MFETLVQPLRRIWFLRTKTARINQRQRIVQDERVAIVRLTEEGIRHHRIRREKAHEARVIDSTFHVDQSEFVVVLMAAETEPDGAGGIFEWSSALAPFVCLEIGHDSLCADDGIDGS